MNSCRTPEESICYETATGVLRARGKKAFPYYKKHYKGNRFRAPNSLAFSKEGSCPEDERRCFGARLLIADTMQGEFERAGFSEMMRRRIRESSE